MYRTLSYVLSCPLSYELDTIYCIVHFIYWALSVILSIFHTMLWSIIGIKISYLISFSPYLEDNFAFYLSIFCSLPYVLSTICIVHVLCKGDRVGIFALAH